MPLKLQDLRKKTYYKETNLTPIQRYYKEINKSKLQ